MRDQLYLSVPLLKTMLAIGLVTVLVTAFLVVAVDFMDWILRRIRRASRIAERRHPSERGVPPEIVGSFERLLAFGLVLFVCDVRTVATVLTVWLGAKLAASWQRVPVKTNELGRATRAGTMAALISGIISVLIGVALGLVVRWALIP